MLNIIIIPIIYIPIIYPQYIYPQYLYIYICVYPQIDVDGMLMGVSWKFKAIENGMLAGFHRNSWDALLWDEHWLSMIKCYLIAFAHFCGMLPWWNRDDEHVNVW